MNKSRETDPRRKNKKKIARGKKAKTLETKIRKRKKTDNGKKHGRNTKRWICSVVMVKWTKMQKNKK